MTLQQLAKDAMQRGYTHIEGSDGSLTPLSDIEKHRRQNGWFYNGARRMPEGQAEIMKLKRNGDVEEED